MNNKITVIIPFYNEEKTIAKTIKKLLSQTLKPAEIIFINSNSTDSSDDIINIYKKKNKIIKTFSLQTLYPSDSKNLGIQLASNSLLAFMDCDLNFTKDWLKSQLALLIKNNLDLVLGSCQLKGINDFDRASVFNTYGYDNNNSCVPGTLVKKSVFIKTGFFLQARSFYDVLWKDKIFKSDLRYETNTNLKLRYFSYNYASNVKRLFLKSSLYSESEINLFYNWKSYIYLFSPILAFFILLFFDSSLFFSILFFIYILARFFRGLLKSKKILKILNIKFLILVICNAVVIDAGKIIGSYRAFFGLIGINSFFAIFSLLFLLIFYSPLYSLLGNILIYKSNIQKADAIVVFSGDGSTDYRNLTYRDRTLEALSYYNKGLSPRIILSSGRDQSLSDVQFIKSYLVSKNVNENIIHVFDKYPSSTYENVLLVGNYLNKKDIKKIIFITAPYHSYRASLIWKKNFPALQVSTVNNVTTKISWNQQWSDIKIITYELLSIFYNKLKNYL